MKQTFKTFLEARVKPYDYSAIEDVRDIADIIAKNALKSFKAMLNGSTIYRGTGFAKKPGIYHPGSGQRKSENTSNEYTMLLDTNPANGGWPKRSSSFIATTGYSMAEIFAHYDDDAISVLLPFDGVDIGVCPTADIWNIEFTFGKLYLPYDSMNKLIRSVVTDGHDLSYGVFVKALDNLSNEELLEKIIDEFGARDAENLSVTDMPEFKKHFKNHYNFNKMDFLLAKAGDSLPDDRELWVSGKCVLIPKPLLDNVITHVKDIA